MNGIETDSDLKWYLYIQPINMFLLFHAYYNINLIFRGFSFASHQFQTPWITVFDGKGNYCESILFTFDYRDSDIISVDSKVKCKF